MATSVLAQTIDQLSREKGIDPAVIVSALEDAMVVAARKYYRTEEPMRSEFDPKTGNINVFGIRTIVAEVADPEAEISLEEAGAIDPSSEVGGEILIPKPTDVLGRIAAQTAKQVILQKVREAERDIVYAEYHERVGELLQCVVKATEGSDVIVDLGRHEGRVTRREQSRLESYGIGDRLRVVIKEVDPEAKTAQVVLSRADASLVQRLFEMEVPEIYDGTVAVKEIAREAGERTKIAVFSNDRDVDAVGACVGMKGMRVQSIIRELRGEKIDIIEWHEEITQFATNALSPAKVARVSIQDAMEKHLEVVVEDSQLSLAIGKKGQNVRLASKLLGWHIDIKSEEEKRQEIEAQMAGIMSAEARTPLKELAGVGVKTLERLSESGIGSIEDLASRTPEELTAIPGIGEKMVEKIADAVRAFFEAQEAATAAAAAPPPEATEEIPEEEAAPSVEETDDAAVETDDAAVETDDAAVETNEADDDTTAAEELIEEPVSEEEAPAEAGEDVVLEPDEAETKAGE
jgi:N utilization substance protein A